MVRLYIVETSDGDWNITRSTPLRELLHIVPRVKPPGTITLGKSVYVVDSHKFRRIPYKPKRYLGMVTNYNQVQLWKENDPDAKDLFDVKERDDDITGEVLAQVAKSMKVKRYLQAEQNWMVLLLIMSVLANIAMAVGFIMLANGGTVSGGGP